MGEEYFNRIKELAKNLKIVHKIIGLILVFYIMALLFGYKIEDYQDRIIYLCILITLGISLYSIHAKKIKYKFYLLSICPLILLGLIGEYLYVLGIVAVVFLVLTILLQEEKQEKIIKLEELYEERKEDKKKIIDLIKDDKFENQTLGIDSIWGTGKTLLSKHILKEIKDEFDIITLTISNLKEEELKPYLYNELNKVLRKNNVYIDILPFSQLDVNFMFFTLSNPLNNKTEYKKLNCAKKEINKLERRIVIVVDDLDRESNTNKIKVLMNLISNLLDDALKIKCLYLFSREELISSHEDITYDFLEKYIPVIEKLTPLNRKKWC